MTKTQKQIVEQRVKIDNKIWDKFVKNLEALTGLKLGHKIKHHKYHEISVHETGGYSSSRKEPVDPKSLTHHVKIWKKRGLLPGITLLKVHFGSEFHFNPNTPPSYLLEGWVYNKNFIQQIEKLMYKYANYIGRLYKVKVKSKVQHKTPLLASVKSKWGYSDGMYR